MTSFRAQATVIVVPLLVGIGSRNLVAMHLPFWTTRASRLVVVDVAPLLCVVVVERRGHRHAGHARLSGCSPSRAHSCSVGWDTAAPGADLRGASGCGRRRTIPQGSCVESGATRRRARLRGHAAWLNAIGQGRVDVLVVVAGLPFIVRRIFEVMDVPGVSERPTANRCPSVSADGALRKRASACCSS